MSFRYRRFLFFCYFNVPSTAASCEKQLKDKTPSTVRTVFAWVFLNGCQGFSGWTVRGDRRRQTLRFANRRRHDKNYTIMAYRIFDEILFFDRNIIFRYTHNKNGCVRFPTFSYIFRYIVLQPNSVVWKLGQVQFVSIYILDYKLLSCQFL